MAADRGYHERQKEQLCIKEEGAWQMEDDETDGNSMELLEKVHTAVTVPEGETRCGLGSWHPQWLQKFASKKVYLVLHGVLGLVMAANGSYYNATISTTEKRFKTPSWASGFISSSYDIGALMVLLPLAYLGAKSHKLRYVGFGTILAGLLSLLMVAPHVMYGAGQDALELTLEYGGVNASIGHNRSVGELSQGVVTCGKTAVGDDDCLHGTTAKTVTAIFSASHIFMGIGGATYFPLGWAYMDDNTRKNIAPIVMAGAQCIRMLGPTFGFTLASYSLSQYVDPSLHPSIDEDDPRWIGAWWLGWIIMAVMTCVFGALFLLFPKQLPRSAKRKAQVLVNKEPLQTSFRDFVSSFRRILTNKLLVFNTFSAMFFAFGTIGYWVFLPKYIETQYSQSASDASIITGSVGLIFTGLGVLTAALVIFRFRPRARYLAAWNIFVEVTDMLARISWLFLGCSDSTVRGSWAEDHSWNLTEPCNADCNCGPNVKYSPVCSVKANDIFFSPCHAGCNTSSIVNGTEVFGDCACIAEGQAVNGPCAVDCNVNFMIFLVTQCIIHFLQSSGKAGNALLSFRCVDEKDKPLSIGFTEIIICAMALIPAPVLYGMVLDSTCIVWGQICGQDGNCWLYDNEKLRYYLNYTSVACLVCGTVLDCFVWFYAKGLQIYDDDAPHKRSQDQSCLESETKDRRI